MDSQAAQSEQALTSPGRRLGATFAALLYQIRGEGLLGQTLGRHLLRIELVDSDTGRPIGAWPAVGRYIIRVLGTYVLGLGVLWILWDRDRQGWHDKALNSLVVHVGRPVHVGQHLSAALRGRW